MFGSPRDDAFLNRAREARPVGLRGTTWNLILLVLLSIGGFLLWAATYEIEEVTTGIGRVIPSSDVQVVQSLEGGIIREIRVREGDRISAGDVLMRIDDTGFASKRGELLEREAALTAETIRLEAEARMAESVAFPEDLIERDATATLAEAAVFRSRREQLSRELTVLQDQRAQREAELAELRAGRDKIRAVSAPLAEEIALTEDMVGRGVVPQVELLRLQARYAELQGDLEIGRASEPRLEAAIREADSQMAAAQSAYVLSARQRLAELQLELSVVQEALRAATDRVVRTTLTAPVDGTVNAVAISTLGAVVQPGAPLVEIVPADDRLLIEADIQPRDVAFIRPGVPASVKVTAYDYLVYGALAGSVVRVGADTVADAEGREVFRAVVETDRTFLGSADAPLPITPGMVASVDIQTGTKTVLSYLAKPILRAQSEALRER